MSGLANKITIYRNRDVALTVTIRTDVGDITGSKLWFSVKHKIDDTDANAVIMKKNFAAGGAESQATVVDGPGRIVAFYIDRPDTVNEECKNYHMDAAIELPSGKRKQLVIPHILDLAEPVTDTGT